MKNNLIPSEDLGRIEKLMLMSKRGTRLVPDEMEYLGVMYEKYPKEYFKIQERVHDQIMSEMNPMYKRKFKE